MFCLNSSPNDVVEADVRESFPSFVKRTQYSKFWFRRERDANQFARAVNPKTIPNRDVTNDLYVVQV
jgi:hypothetical protein